jgi:glycosyltransferase involved in cell wall biosynthesis
MPNRKKHNNKSKTIFIQIASYRDPELTKTVKDCIDNASDASRLVFSICRQYSPDDEGMDELPEYRDDKRFKIIDVLYTESKGVCWARNQVQQQYNGEDYTLQIDSHHRFAPGWDETLIGMLKQLQEAGHKKPLLTSYIPSFDPENDPEGRVQEPWKMDFDRFIPEGAVFFLPSTIEGWKDIDAPVPSRFYSAHMCFTLGKFTEEVQHDPEYYFHGEEISIAVRAYTHGYDLFHPHRPVIWHEYTRKGRTKHWDDHTGANKTTNWGVTNSASHLRNRKLFEMDGLKRDIDFGKYGFGTERTVRDYEKYAGICFSNRGVQQYTLDRKYPPGPEVPDDKFVDSCMTIFKHCIDVGFEQLPLDDYDFWCVAFKDEQGNDLFRKDADENEIQRMKSDPDGYFKIWREFNIKTKPKSWLVWPHSKSKGWCDQIVGNL